ncbi:MAG TPA: SDR family NAD(P)-dependent oxidoreductase [Gemmatimonadaceae bacterium]|nr:SDR family NAD(P)-dependent oxidoreductase [Gemmatimonadaceae bacterium]
MTATPVRDVMSLAGKRALITGGSRGIGAAAARLFARAGVDVAIGYRSRGYDASVVVEQCRAFGVRVHAVAADIGTRNGAEQLVDESARFLGGLDFFVANAGIWPVEAVPVATMDDERWSRTMRENVDAMFFTCRAAARVLSEHGRIVMVSSTAGQRGEADHADYAASKGAMISFVKSMCIELAARDITVNCVAPGWVDTEMAASAYEGEGRGRVARGIPIGRIATADDIAGPIVFLCSPLARHITGEVVNVNGGSVLCG